MNASSARGVLDMMPVWQVEIDVDAARSDSRSAIDRNAGGFRHACGRVSARPLIEGDASARAEAGD